VLILENYKTIKQVAVENGIRYHTLRQWIKKGLVEVTVIVSGKQYFSIEQEKKFIDNLIKK
jgi:predicted site-specific integrase-resolvase